MTITDLLARLDAVTPEGDGQWSARCPAHDDRTASLSVGIGDDHRILACCHAGCSTAAIVGAIGCELRDLFQDDQPNWNDDRNGHHGHAEAKTHDHRANQQAVENRQTVGFGRIVKTNDYRAADGTLLYQACRLDPKDFRQRAPDGNGGWTWKTKGIERVLYRLPELLAADPAAVVFVVEGEKDADNLARIGLVSTTNIGGAGKWRESYSDALRAGCGDPARQ